MDVPHEGISLDSSQRKIDFFISRNGADSAWAQWIATELEEAGYSTILQDWDFRPGQNFISRMQDASTQSERTIAVLSPQYLNAEFTQPEWMAAFRQDPKGDKGLLIPVRVREYDRPGLLASLAYIDLIGLDEGEARQRLLQGIKRGRAKKKQAFPGGRAAPPKTEQPFPGTLPEIFNVPHRRNPNFTGRDELLLQLHEALGGGESAAISHAIHGLGGVGKTQLAVEYAYRYASEYSVIWWLRSEAPESLDGDFEALAQKLRVVPEDHRVEQSSVIQAVRAALEQGTDWLLVFDNARRPDEIRPYLPRGSSGHVIITSRYSSWSDVAKPLPLKVWESAESVRFLMASTAQRDRTAAGELAEELGQLPLALEQAAAYIEQAGGTLAEYLELFRQRKLELFQAGSSGSHEDATVATTWNISLQEVGKSRPASAAVLNLCAFLAPDDIPVQMLVNGAEHLPDELGAVVQDSSELAKAIIGLRDNSLAEVGGDKLEDPGLSIHRLVQAVTRDRLSEAGQRTWAAAAVSVVNKAFPGEPTDVRTLPACARLSAHAAQAAEHAERLDVGLEAAARLLNQLGLYSQGRAELAQAKGYHERALRIYEATLGEEHPFAATALNNIGHISKAQGDLAQALKYTKRALAIDEKAYGPEHPALARDANNIGTILRDQGDLAGALEYTKRALAIGERVDGPEHPEVATHVNNIGAILKTQGDLAEALKYAKRALAFDENVYGPEHPAAARDANNIAAILKTQEDLAGALKYAKRALAIVEKVYGPEHPDIAIRANNIGLILEDQGNLAGARRYLERALRIFQKFLGDDHPNTLAVRRNLETLG